jgi:hypothetical protein
VHLSGFHKKPPSLSSSLEEQKAPATVKNRSGLLMKMKGARFED